MQTYILIRMLLRSVNIIFENLESVDFFAKNPGDFSLRILTGKKHRQIKLQRLQKIQIWALG